MLLRTLPSVVVVVGGGADVTVSGGAAEVVVGGGRSLVIPTILLSMSPDEDAEVGGMEVAVSGGAEEVVVGGRRSLVTPRILLSMSPEDADVEVGGTDVGVSDVGVEDVDGSVGAEDGGVSDGELALDDPGSGVGFVKLVSTDVAGRRLVTSETALLAALFTYDAALLTPLPTLLTALPASLTTLPAPETTFETNPPPASGVVLGAGVIELGSPDDVAEEPDGAADPASGVEPGDDELPPPTIPT